MELHSEETATLLPWRNLPEPPHFSYWTVVTNDDEEQVRGRLALAIEVSRGKELSKQELPFAVAGYGQQTYTFQVVIPEAPGDCMIRVTAYPEGSRHLVLTVSQRKFTIAE